MSYLPMCFSYLYCTCDAAIFVSTFLSQFLQKCKKCRAGQLCTPVMKSLMWKDSVMVVPLSDEDAASPIPSLSHRRLQRYRPIPVEL